MSQYQFELEKGSNKVHCPSCGKKRAVRYMDNGTGQPLPEKYAKCDRVENCAYHESPYKDGYAKEHSNNTFKAVKMPEIKSEIVTIPNEYVIASIGDRTNQREKNTLYKYMSTFIDKEKVNRAFDMFKIGTVRNQFFLNNSVRTENLEGCSIFWLLNEAGHAQGGEIAYIDPVTGSTYKHEGQRCTRAVWTHYIGKEKSSPDGPSDWILKFKDQTQSVTVNKKPHLFGLHQLRGKHLKKPIAIVEAPKTALIASCFYPQFTWMAAMSVTGLTMEKLEPLKSHRIILYPDKGKFAKGGKDGAFLSWKKKCIQFSKEGYMIHISNVLEKIDHLNNGDDLADILTPKIKVPDVSHEPKVNKTPIQSDMKF